MTEEISMAEFRGNPLDGDREKFVDTAEDELAELNLDDVTVLQYVIRSDAKREQLLRESRILSNAFEATKDPNAPVRACRQLSHERLERELEQLRQVAIRRSGARGAKTRIALNELDAPRKERWCKRRKLRA